MKRPLRWIPLYVDPWLFGSTRLELTLEQRSVWVDLLTMAGKDSGFIRANEDTAYPLDQLAGFLRVPLDILEGTIDRCIEVGKLERLPNGTLHVVKWEVYRLTPQYRRRLSPLTHTLTQSRVEESRVEESKGKGNIGSPNRNIVSKKGNREQGKGEGKDGERPPFNKLPFEAQHEIVGLRKLKEGYEKKLKEIQESPGKQIYDDVKDDSDPYKNFKCIPITEEAAKGRIEDLDKQIDAAFRRCT